MDNMDTSSLDILGTVKVLIIASLMATTMLLKGQGMGLKDQDLGRNGQEDMVLKEDMASGHSMNSKMMK